MEKDPSTPERELLKIIESKKDSSLASKENLRRGISLFSWGAFRGRFSFFRGNFRSMFSSLAFDIKSINRFLILLLGVSIFFLSFNIFDSYRKIDKQIIAIFKIKPPRSFKFSQVSVLKKLPFYLEKARKRDIFKMAWEIKKEKEKQKISLTKKEKPSLITEKVRDLKLVGIAWSEDPDVMIEDTKTKRTFFLKRGDYINDLEVKAIFKDKVILGYKSEEIELK